MANWDFILPYDGEAADWLGRQGYPHPPVRAGNRLPTWAEVARVVEALGLPNDAPLAAEMSQDGETLKMRGELLLELGLLRGLCAACGQLWLYPDCGSPAIVVDATILPGAVAEAWHASLDAEDCWQAFHQRVYGP